ncbi:putative oxidoreductase [Arthroderma uncinatum]|uniref:putative oxidoreductase n=1 Tax=Arthroderma uncinatum TaxID=74035 RepID=UPI00144A70A2|nr:putative oxidoreductase [Arthroderma uncinatum]KAF3492143.1 putative oxidoreductase [Arthroderma uncinatum]
MEPDMGRVLRNDGVKVFNVSPGFLATTLSDDRVTGQQVDKRAMGAIDPAIGGGFCADIVEGKMDEQA